MTATPHGTLAAWNTHQRDNGNPCPPCRAAASGYQTGRRHWLKLERNLSRCGTELGIEAHYVLDEPLCPLCDAWQAGYRQGLTREKP